MPSGDAHKEFPPRHSEGHQEFSFDIVEIVARNFRPQSKIFYQPLMNHPEPQTGPSSSRQPFEGTYSGLEETLDLGDLFQRLRRGAALILGLGLLGLVLGAVGYLAISPVMPTVTSTRVVFSFPGFERGEYPDKSKFQPDDLRMPVVVSDALRRLGLDASEDNQSKIRAAITIEGIIPDAVVKARDRMRAAGQNPPVYIPDEYLLTLTLNRDFPLSRVQRQQLLLAIVNAASENFQRTYGQLPLAIGSAFETLRGADLPEYEMVFRSEIDGLLAFLNNEVELAKGFRSPTTNLSFRDLIERTNIFARIHLNEVLGLIHQQGLANDRQTSLVKMDYYIQQLGYEEQHALEDEKLVRDLLGMASTREQSYVLGTKSQAMTRPGETPVLDQGLIDSLTANDAYNFLVRKALDSGLTVKRIQAEKVRITEMRDNLAKFDQARSDEKVAALAQIRKSLSALESTYNELVSDVRKTNADFAFQQYGNAIRLGADVTSTNQLKILGIAGIVGAFLGIALGAGLSLLGFQIGGKKAA